MSAPTTAFFISKLNPATPAHVKLIERALRAHDDVYVYITSKEWTELVTWKFLLLKLMVDPTLAEGLHVGIAPNLFAALENHKSEPLMWYCGADRAVDYAHAVKYYPHLSAHIEPRPTGSISSTRVREMYAAGDHRGLLEIYTPGQLEIVKEIL